MPIKGHQIADGTVEGVDIDWDPHLEMKGHIIPDTHATGNSPYPGWDIGSAEKKVRHLFLSSNSLWIGDSHKVDIEGGKKKHRKRKKSSPPKSLRQLRQTFSRSSSATASLTTASESAQDEQIRSEIEVMFAGVPVDVENNQPPTALAHVTLAQWIQYAQSIDGHGDPASLTVMDIFNPEEEDDWEEVIEDGEGISPHAPATSLFLKSSTPSSTKVFEIKVDDAGTITATEVVP